MSDTSHLICEEDKMIWSDRNTLMAMKVPSLSVIKVNNRKVILSERTQFVGHQTKLIAKSYLVTKFVEHQSK